MDTLLKERVIALVNNCDDEDKLKTIESNLLVDDWWDELSEEEQEEILETNKRVEAGIKFSDEHAQNIFKKWREK